MEGKKGGKEYNMLIVFTYYVLALALCGSCRSCEPSFNYPYTIIKIPPPCTCIPYYAASCPNKQSLHLRLLPKCLVVLCSVQQLSTSACCISFAIESQYSLLVVNKPKDWGTMKTPCFFIVRPTNMERVRVALKIAISITNIFQSGRGKGGDRGDRGLGFVGHQSFLSRLGLEYLLCIIGRLLSLARNRLFRSAHPRAHSLTPCPRTLTGGISDELPPLAAQDQQSPHRDTWMDKENLSLLFLGRHLHPVPRVVHPSTPRGPVGMSLHYLSPILTSRPLSLRPLPVPEPLVDLLAGQPRSATDSHDLLPLPVALPALVEALQSQPLVGGLGHVLLPHAKNSQQTQQQAQLASGCVYGYIQVITCRCLARPGSSPTSRKTLPLFPWKGAARSRRQHA